MVYVKYTEIVVNKEAREQKREKERGRGRGKDVLLLFCCCFVVIVVVVVVLLLSQLLVLMIRKSTRSGGSGSVKVNIQPLAVAPIPHASLLILLRVRLALLVHELSQTDVSDAGGILSHQMDVWV